VVAPFSAVWSMARELLAAPSSLAAEKALSRKWSMTRSLTSLFSVSRRGEVVQAALPADLVRLAQSTPAWMGAVAKVVPGTALAQRLIIGPWCSIRTH
jgi:hypothetical protein